MAEPAISFYELEHHCKAAIGRARAEIRAGRQGSAAMEEAITFVITSVTPRFWKRARQALRDISQDAIADAVSAMVLQLLEDIHNLNYPSLEVYFGSYLGHMTTDVILEIRQNFERTISFSWIEGADADPATETAVPRQFADEATSAVIDDLATRTDLAQAMHQLPQPDRLVIARRLQGQTNGAIAREIGVSEPQGTYIYKRAVAHLRRLLHAAEE